MCYFEVMHVRKVSGKSDKRNIRCIIGIDEAGRGPIAGPLAVGGVMMMTTPSQPPPLKRWRGYLLPYFFKNIRDSKQLSPKLRDAWFKKLRDEKKKGVCNYSISFISHTVIDKHGISYALRIGVARVLAKLGAMPEETFVLLDGSLRAPKEFLHQETIVRGDEKIPIISLASIAAKVSRDRLMMRHVKKFPQYNFQKHKGYGTQEHYAAIAKYGMSEIHRKAFCK